MSSPTGEPESVAGLAAVWDQEPEECREDEDHDSQDDTQARLVERRIEYLAPLVAYVRGRGMQFGRLLGQVSLLARVSGQPINFSGRLWPRTLERGLSVIPPWLVEQYCVVLSQPVAAVMGDEWVKRFGADGRGGEESAPVGSPRIRRPNRSYGAFWQGVDAAGEGNDHAA